MRARRGGGQRARAGGEAAARAQVLNGRGLVDSEADGALGRGERVQPAVGPAHREQRAAHDAVRVAVHEVVERVGRGDAQRGDRVRERK